MLDPAAFGLTLADEDLPKQLEAALAAAGHCPEPWLGAGLAPLLGRAGKRFRPALVFTSAGCGKEPDLRTAVSCAAAVELIHLSSLVHDDLMDEADGRSGVPTLHASLGPEAAILGGDFLLAAGARLLADVSGTAVGVCLRAYADMCQGQAREMSNRYRINIGMEDYLLAVSGKTAAIMEAACRLGGLCSGLPEVQVEALGQFGHSLGMVFQLVDDLMDVVSTEELWGKPVEHDMTNGVYTVCILTALEQSPEPVRGPLGRKMSPEQISKGYELARQFGVGPAVSLIDRYVRGAAAAMEALPASRARDELADLPRRYVSDMLGTRVPPQHKSLVSAALEAMPGGAPHAGSALRISV